MTLTGTSLIEGKKFGKAYRQNKKGLVIQLINSKNSLLWSMNSPIEGQLETLLLQYSKVFSEPTELPPHKTHNHHIVLQSDSKPVCVSPYRYPYFQKIEIEKIIQGRYKLE